jgi:hypothetical protein
MAKSKPPRRKMQRLRQVYGDVKTPGKPKWMWVARLITIILLSIFMLIAIAGIMIKYYRFISNHK